MFIDSLIKTIPTPSIILADFSGEDENGCWKERYEIIDGVQRIDTIVSFVMNKFSIKCNGKELYYGTNCMSALICHDRDNIHPLESCNPYWRLCYDIGQCNIPVIRVSYFKDVDREIEEIYRRVNSTGRVIGYAPVQDEAPALDDDTKKTIRGMLTLGRSVYEIADFLDISEVDVLRIQKRV